jgi:hypothetical protein
MEQAIKVDWIDRGREPQCQPDPAYPAGIDLDCSHGAEATCKIDLPYPAKRCGYFVVTCEACLQRIIITTAGRLDDPRSVRLGCLMQGHRATPS